MTPMLLISQHVILPTIKLSARWFPIRLPTLARLEMVKMIEASGFIEQGGDGKKRLLVGTSREAVGEYIRIVN